MQVFTDQEQGLHLALAQQQALERLQRALAPLRGIEGQEQTVLRQGVQQREQRGDRLLECLVQGQDLPRDLGADGARLVAVLHVAIAPEQVNDREVRGGFTVGHRHAFQHPPALGVMGVDEFVDQAGLPHPGLPDQRHDLALARSSPLERLAQGGQLRVTPHKARQAPGHPRLEAGPQRTRAR